MLGGIIYGMSGNHIPKRHRLTCVHRQVRDELNHEALQFVKEQRIRCLLVGAWFPHAVSYADSGPVTKQTINRSLPSNWRFVRLSHNRRYLHYADFDTMKPTAPNLDDLSEKSKSRPNCPAVTIHINQSAVDLSVVSSVVSNVSASPPSTASSTATLKQSLSSKPPPVKAPALKASTASTKITIHGYLPRSTNTTGEEKEQVLLQLLPPTHTLASEWLDGLLMLLNQQPITADTNKLVNLIGGYGLKIRLLNVRFDEGEVGVGRNVAMPSREGVDEAYWYDIGGMDQG